MEFKKFSVDMKQYGTGQQPTRPQEENVSFHDDDLDEMLSNSQLDGSKQLEKFLVFLALCHTVIVDDRTKKYSAASPDELALVNFAKQCGYEFLSIDTDSQDVTIKLPSGVERVYNLLNVCEFSSTRKRMSCIYRDPEGRIILMCKGADSVIAELLN